MDRVEEVRIHTQDGVPLAATVFFPSQPQDPPVVVTIHSATGVLRRYYAKYAAFLAENGLFVVTWDPRGIGDSLLSRKDLLRKDFSKVSWGRVDFEAVLEFCEKRWPRAEIVHIGHSVGAHVFALAPRSDHVSRMMAVCAHNPYYGFNQPMLYRWYMWCFWHCLVAPLKRFFGYMPARMLGLFEDLPRGVIDDWMRWMASPLYICREPELATRIHEWNGSILCISAENDEFATFDQIKSFIEMFKSAQSIEHMRLPRIGHLAMFREKNRDVWKATLPFLQLRSRL